MKKITKIILAAALLIGITGCSKGSAEAGDSKETQVVKLGLMGDDIDVWDDVKERLSKEGIELEYVKFSDYNQPNAALADGSIDINSFQHQFFLDNYNEEHGTDRSR